MDSNAAIFTRVDAMDPERREEVLQHDRARLYDDDEDDADDGKYDAELEADDPRWQQRQRSPSPPPEPRQPPQPPPYHAQPDWGGGAEAEEEQYEAMPLGRAVLSASDESLEEYLGKWARRRADDAAPTLDDIDPSDDEYVEGDPALTRQRRMAMQRYRSKGYTGDARPLIDEMLAHPDVALQPRFYGLPLDLDQEMRGLSLGPFAHDPQEVWNTFWRFCDRNWCFFCHYRRTTLVEEYSDIFRLMVEKMTRPLFDHDEEVIVDEVQSMWFTSVQPHLPARAPCRRTGRARPQRYLWKSCIRRHMRDHVLRPVHDMVEMQNVLKRANEWLASSMVKRHKKNPADVKVDLSKMKHLRENMDMIVRFGKDIKKGSSEYRI
jgi:hypothetical protein